MTDSSLIDETAGRPCRRGLLVQDAGLQYRPYLAQSLLIFGLFQEPRKCCLPFVSSPAATLSIVLASGALPRTP